MKKSFLLILLLVLLPYASLLKPGFPSLQDQMHPLRLTDLIQCFQDHQIPCRYSSKSGLGYGYPLFNFYGQGAYLLPTVLSFIVPLNSYELIKVQIILFAYIGGLGIFLYSKKKNLNTPLSILFATIFTYSPYFALDTFVRGAIPEFSALMLTPWVFFLTQHKKWLFSNLVLFLIIFTHIQTGLLILLFNTVYLIFTKKVKIAAISFVAVIALSSFYLMPIIFENKLVQLNSTTQGYFDYNTHFLNIKQIFISTFWGYGASTWLTKDGMGFFLGFPLTILLLVSMYIFFRSNNKSLVSGLLLAISILLIFLTHTRSAFVWSILPLSFYQFPWRFIGLASVFTTILAISLFSENKLILKPILLLGLTIITIVINLPYFKPDQILTYAYLDSPQKQLEISLGGIRDYWPITGKITPTTPAPNFLLSNKNITKPITTKFIRTSKQLDIAVISSIRQEVIIPMAYFPGWELYLDNKKVNIDLDLSTGFPKISIDPGLHEINMSLKKTNIQKYSEYLSLMVVLVLVYLKIKNGKNI